MGTTPSLVVASPAYLAKESIPTTPPELLRHNCVRYTHLTTAREWRFRGPDGPLSVPVGGNVALNHGAVMLEMALAGVGIARLPSFLVAAAIADGRLVTLLDDCRIEPTSIHLLFPTAAHTLPKTKVFVDTIAAGLRARLRGV